LRRFRSNTSADTSIRRKPANDSQKDVDRVNTRNAAPATSPTTDHFMRRTVCRYSVVSLTSRAKVGSSS
jgi:hypothetical protein